jgi:hypothetical protein
MDHYWRILYKDSVETIEWCGNCGTCQVKEVGHKGEDVQVYYQVGGETSKTEPLCKGD